LAFLMFGSPEDIGLDPHFEINPLDGHIRKSSFRNSETHSCFAIAIWTRDCGP
jgi:hypothetical protein